MSLTTSEEAFPAIMRSAREPYLNTVEAILRGPDSTDTREVFEALGEKGYCFYFIHDESEPFPTLLQFDGPSRRLIIGRDDIMAAVPGREPETAVV